MSQRPNFLIICADQMQSRCIGANGHKEVKTPHLDRLAASGVTFRRAYCNNPVCQPSRATMFTGLTPRQHGLLTNGNKLSPDVPTIGGILSDAGYRTHAVGKLHLQPFGGLDRLPGSKSTEARDEWNNGEIDSLPLPYYGFQSADYVGGHVNYAFGDYGNWLKENHPETLAALRESRASVKIAGAYRMDGVPEEHHYNHWIADCTTSFLTKASDDDQPFFVWCSFPDPHFPFAACQPYADMYDPAELALSPTLRDTDDPTPYLQAIRDASPKWSKTLDEAYIREATAQTYGMITHMDACIGRVLDALEENGLADNTVVAFVADHGEYLGTHGLIHKGSWPYDELTNVPCIWHAPGNTPATVNVDDTVSLLDLVPTIADYAGIPAKAFDTRGQGQAKRIGLPGESLRPYLEGATPEAHDALLEYDEDWFDGLDVCRGRGLVHGTWKIYTYGGQSGGLLFDLANDPHETTNLWDDPDHTEIKAELLTRLVNNLTRSDRFDAFRMCGA